MRPDGAAGSTIRDGDLDDQITVDDVPYASMPQSLELTRRAVERSLSLKGVRAEAAPRHRSFDPEGWTFRSRPGAADRQLLFRRDA